MDSLYYDMQKALARRLEEAGIVRKGEMQAADRTMKVCRLNWNNRQTDCKSVV